jgi:anti-sigma B factor antagonist
MAFARTAPFQVPAELVTDLRLCASGATVTVRGEVDLHTAPVLRERLAEIVSQGEERVVVFLDDVTFMDSVGVGVLVGADQAQSARGGTMEIVCDEPRVLRVLHLTGRHRVLTIHGDSTPPRGG